MKINHLGISGGKDSTALLLWSVHESGYPKESIRATFADTGNELEATLNYVRFLSENVHPIEWIRPEKDFFELAEHKHRFPSAKVRFCTVDLKLKPSRDYCYGLIEDGHEVLLHTGVRASESESRALLAETGFDDWIGLPVRRPLLRWSIEDVWAIHKRYGIEPNPLYAMGFRRVGCAPCVMSRKEDIKLTASLFPARFDRIREAEKTAENHGYNATFFASDKVPKRFRLRQMTTKEGEQSRIANIDDVVRWASTGYRGEESGSLFEDEPVTCSHTSGACE